jgi:hypothetical protein
VQLWLKQDPPPRQVPQSTALPQTVPAPHSQSTPQTGTWQQTPFAQMSLPQVQSVAQVPQFSPAAQIPSPQTGLHVPPWHVVPAAHEGPHDPPQLSGPQVEVPHDGVQQAGVMPASALQTWPFAHGQSPGHAWQFSPEFGWHV